MFVRRSKLERAEADIRTLLARFAEAVAAATEAQASHRDTLARFNEMAVIADGWRARYAEQTEALRSAQEELAVARWVIRIPGNEHTIPHALVGDYDPNGH